MKIAAKVVLASIFVCVALLAWAALTPSPVAGYVFSGGNWAPLSGGGSGTTLGYTPSPVGLYTWTGSAWQPWAGGTSGTVTSVTGDGVVECGTVTASGTFTLCNAAANTILGNGTGGSAAPTYLTTLPTAAEPGFTGDVTKAAGSVATTVGSINGATVPISKTVVGTNGSGQIIDATASFPQPLFSSHTSAVGVTNTGNTTANQIAALNYVMPANTMGANSKLLLVYSAMGCTGSGVPYAACGGANTGTCSIRIGLAATNNASTANLQPLVVSAIASGVSGRSFMANQNATNVNIFMIFSTPVVGSTAAGSRGTFDVTTQLFVNPFLQNSVSGDICGFPFYELWLYPAGYPV